MAARSTPLADAFLAAAPEKLAAALGPAAALEPRLEALCARAREAWPDLGLPTDGFVRHAAAGLASAPGDPGAALDAIFAGDLYLAYGCSLGNGPALAAFERHFMPQATSYLTRRDALPGFADDFKQQLRARLLVAESGLGPRIAGYGGRAPLGAWLRIAAARLAINLRGGRRADEKAAVADHAVAPLRTAVDDPELAYFRAHYAPVLREATAAALAALDPRQATVLRLYFLQSMTSEAIGATLRVSPRTVRRQVADARARILAETQRLLRERLDVTMNQVESIIRLATDELGPSVVKFFQDPDKP